MAAHRRRLLLLLAALPVVLVAVALSYKAGMAFFEGQERTFWRALGWAAETITTTGYGADARWRHPTGPGGNHAPHGTCHERCRVRVQVR